jgi:hypothetical protein
VGANLFERHNVSIFHHPYLFSSETLATTCQNARYYNREDYRLRDFKCYKLFLLENVFRMTAETKETFSLERNGEVCFFGTGNPCQQ